MTLSATKKIGHSGRQLSMRDLLSLDPVDALKVAIQEAIKGCSLSRAQIAEDMNRLAKKAGIIHEGRSDCITEAILDKWAARGSKTHQIPARYILILCMITDSIAPIEAILPPGHQIISGEEIACLKWAQIEKDRKRLNRESRRIAQEAGIE